MAAMDVAMFEDPLLLRCDSLWGCDDDLLTLLNCDMALDDELPTLPLLSPQLPTAAACGVGLGAHQQELHVTPPIAAPAPPPLSPQTSSGSGAAGPHYLPCAVCKGPRRSASPSLSGNHHIAAPSLPALQGTGTAGAWRTVTTTAQPASASHNAAPPAGQPIPLTRMPSSATSGAPPTSSSEDAAPPPAKQPRSSAASRARRPAASKPPAPAAARKQQPAAVLSEDDTDSEDSNDTEEHLAEEGVQGAKSNKRKAPEIDWRSIEDPAERRRQRRLAKNRVTAARSRERKKSQWAEMEDKLNAMEAENRSLRQMLESMSKDNEGLRAQLAAALGGAGSKAASAAAGAGAAAKGGKHTHEPAVLLIIVTLLVCAFLPSSSSSSPTARQQAAQAPAALGGALLLAELLLRSSTKSSCGNWSSKPGACSEDNADAETDPMQVDAAPAYNTPSLHGLALGALAQPVLVKSEPGAGMSPYLSTGGPGYTAAPPGRAAGAAALLHALLLCVLAALRRGVRAAKGLPPLVVRRVQQAVKAAPAATSLFRQGLHSLAGPSTACAAI